MVCLAEFLGVSGMQKKYKKKKPIKQIRDRHARIVGVVFTLLLVYLVYQIYDIQVIEGDHLRRRAVVRQNLNRQANVSQEVPPARGQIMDRHGQPLATTIPVFRVFLDVNLLHQAYFSELGTNRTAGRTARDAHIAALNEHLGIPSAELLAYFAHDTEGNLLNPRGASHRVVARDVEPEIAIYLQSNYRHIHATRTSLRWYEDPFFAPQVIGFIRGDTQWGLEASYNIHLEGSPGRTFITQGEEAEIPVQDGYTLITTLDSDIQRLAQSIVDQTYTELAADAIAMIVMNPNTGEILGMAQAPTFSVADPFNPNLTTDTWLQRNWDYMNEQQRIHEMNQLWQNFHILHTYEQGSVFKPIVIAAAIEEGMLDTNPHRMFFCNRWHYVGGERLSCWTDHGALSLREVIYRSCNVAMFEIMSLLSQGQPDTFYRYRGYFGFGARTGVDLLGETAVSSPAVMYPRAMLGALQRATSSIGQGFNATTLQVINAYAALINGGKMMQPFLVSHIVDDFGNIVHENQPTVVRRVISEETSDFIRREMQHVVSAPGGTAHTALIPGHAVGGKTGTGQQGIRALGIDSLTYVSFTPVENPEFLVLMVAHNIRTEAHIGAGREIGPRVSRFFQELISIRGLPPSDGPGAIDAWQDHILGTDLMPDYSGWRLADAVNDLINRSNSGYSVIGSGTIVYSTFPSPGRPMPQVSTVTFNMKPDTRIEGQMVFLPDVVDLTVEAAHSLLREIGLVPVLRESTSPQTSPSLYNGIPRTTNVELRDEYQYGEYDSQPEPLQYIVYQQFPAPDTELERGTRVMLRAR
jgi:stage V sporulation protein D (sporulation-specific penicillin-binding protein)